MVPVNNYTHDDVTGEYVLLPNAASNYKSSDNVYAALTLPSAAVLRILAIN